MGKFFFLINENKSIFIFKIFLVSYFQKKPLFMLPYLSTEIFEILLLVLLFIFLSVFNFFLNPRSLRWVIPVAIILLCKYFFLTKQLVVVGEEELFILIFQRCIFIFIYVWSTSTCYIAKKGEKSEMTVEILRCTLYKKIQRGIVKRNSIIQTVTLESLHGVFIYFVINVFLLYFVVFRLFKFIYI